MPWDHIFTMFFPTHQQKQTHGESRRESRRETGRMASSMEKEPWPMAIRKAPGTIGSKDE